MIQESLLRKMKMKMSQSTKISLTAAILKQLHQSPLQQTLLSQKLLKRKNKMLLTKLRLTKRLLMQRKLGQQSKRKSRSRLSLAMQKQNGFPSLQECFTYFLGLPQTLSSHFTLVSSLMLLKRVTLNRLAPTVGNYLLQFW